MGNIYLIGFMGAGKSVVGRRLSARLGRPFCDTDELVVEKAGLPIPEIFSRLGEAAFRLLEAEAVREVAGKDGLVVALGGGAPLREENWGLIRKSGVTVYLKEAPEVLFARLSGDAGRPLLSGTEGEARLRRIKVLLEAREPRYLEADLVISCRGRPPEEIAAEIEERLRGCKGLR
ncbi:MAG: 3-dehydroquinate synthase [Acetothermia bacterium 64_32]|nr:MAG: 3-dehydroquinate synthase [Acetothermia bacterium 64_32]HAF69749.1 shikimate kinase [Candidatus Acetothermia bacterium]